jgi:hypothetical protein
VKFDLVISQIRHDLSYFTKNRFFGLLLVVEREACHGACLGRELLCDFDVPIRGLKYDAFLQAALEWLLTRPIAHLVDLTGNEPVGGAKKS